VCLGLLQGGRLQDSSLSRTAPALIWFGRVFGCDSLHSLSAALFTLRACCTSTAVALSLLTGFEVAGVQLLQLVEVERRQVQ
jgi:hypothetical protein